MNHSDAMGPVSISVRIKLAAHFRLQKDADMLADDMLKLIATGRDPEGFRAVNEELDRMSLPAATELKAPAVKISKVPKREPSSREQNFAIAKYVFIICVIMAVYCYMLYHLK